MPHEGYDTDIHVDLVLPRLKPHDPHDLWAQMARGIAPHAPAFSEYELHTRMRDISAAPDRSGVGDGVAAIHIHTAPARKPLAALAVLARPVELCATDGISVDMVYALIAPRVPPGLALRRIARITRLLKCPDLRAQLRAESCPDAALGLLAETLGGQIAA